MYGTEMKSVKKEDTEGQFVEKRKTNSAALVGNAIVMGNVGWWDFENRN